jgi:hypothetical protein
MIKLVGVEKTLGGQPVLRGVDLTIPEGKLTTDHRGKRLGEERAAEAHDRPYAA